MLVKAIDDLFILLVEPSHTQAKIILKELKGDGITHFNAAIDGHSALQAMRTFHPDLVISSMHLPDMTAIDLVQTMRDDDELKAIAFMLVSSETSFEYLDPIKQAGVSAILPKPFSSSQMKRALINTLDMLNPDELQVDNFNAEDLKVLIVDDSAMARKHIKRVLHGLGIEQIIEADDGISAVPVLQEHFFDFVVTDYNMPKMDGKELLKHIRNTSNQQSIPVLMVTSEGNMGKLAAVEQEGVSGICDKPFEIDIVRELIRNMMREV
jgi:two-component system chemotaxis response regulator CheY